MDGSNKMFYHPNQNLEAEGQASRTPQKNGWKICIADYVQLDSTSGNTAIKRPSVMLSDRDSR